MRSIACFILVWVAAVGPVEAQCGPCTCEELLAVQVGATVPSNLRVFVRWPARPPEPAELPRATLTDELGAEVEVVLEPAGDASGGAFWLSPLVPVLPGTYHLVVQQALAVRAADLVVTSEAIDGTAPVFTLLEVATPPREHCGNLDGVFLQWAATSDRVENLVLEVEVWRGAELLGVVFPSTIRRGSSPGLGSSPFGSCYGPALVDGVMPGDELTLRARLWDAAGNVSDVRTITVLAEHFPARESCERWCSATAARGRHPSRATTLLAVVVAGALARRWRRITATARGSRAS